MNPDDATLLLYQQFVEVLAAHIADVQQDGRIAQSLFHPDATDVHRAPRQVVRRVRQVPVPCAHTQVPVPMTTAFSCSPMRVKVRGAGIDAFA